MLSRLIRRCSFCFFLCLVLLLPATAAELDSGFGNDGRVAVELGVYGDRANAVAVQPDGRIVVGGSSSSSADLDFLLFRLLPDGSLDPDFNFDGTVITPAGSGDDEVLSVALQPDGKILAAGYSSNGEDRDFALARFNSDGSIDTDFGIGGIVVTPVGNGDDEVTDLTLQPDGSIVVTGTTTGTAGQVVVLGRYLPDGTLDSGFADSGFSFTGVGNDAQAESVALADNGRIIVSGSYAENGTTGLMLLGFAEGGQLDTSFGNGGVAVPGGDFAVTEGYGSYIEKDGTILVAGSVGEEGQRDAALFRFTADGRPDTAFEDNGILVTSVSEQDDVLYDVTMSGDTIAATGFTSTPEAREFLYLSYENDTVTVRRTPVAGEDGSQLHIAELQVENSFDEYQEEQDSDMQVDVLTTSFNGENDIATALADVDGSGVVVVGVSAQGETTSAAISKYVPLSDPLEIAPLSLGSPYILTGQAYDVTRTSAVIPVRITFSQALSVTQRGIVFSTLPNPILKEGDNNPDNPDNPDVPVDDVGPVRSNLGPSGTVKSSSTTLTLTTDVDAKCKYTLQSASMDYNDMKLEFDQTGGKSHSEPVDNLSDGVKKYYVRCKDSASGVENKKSATIQFTVDTTGSGGGLDPDGGPTRINLLPKGIVTTTDDVHLSLTTLADADCKYSTSDVSYDNMTGSFTSDAYPGRLHVSPTLNLTDGDSYTYYVLCKNRNFPRDVNSEPAIISFKVDTSGTTVLTAPILNHVASAVGNFLVPSAMAEDSTVGDTSGDSGTGSLFDPEAGDDFVEEGYTEEGTGTEPFHSRLEKLKPGTFFYARAYVVVNGKVTYGNQVGFRTGDSCFVATAAFGSIFHPYVKILRDFRDDFLLDNHLGRTLVSLYFRYSPPVADVIAAHDTLRLIVRILLLPIVGMAWLLMQLGIMGLLLLTIAGAAGIYALRVGDNRARA